MFIPAETSVFCFSKAFACQAMGTDVSELSLAKRWGPRGLLGWGPKTTARKRGMQKISEKILPEGSAHGPSPQAHAALPVRLNPRVPSGNSTYY